MVRGLRDRGHQPVVAAPDSLDFGSAQMIVRLPAITDTDTDADSDGGAAPDVPRYAGGSDPRRDGQAIGC